MEKASIIQSHLLTSEEALELIQPYIEVIREAHYWSLQHLVAIRDLNIDIGLALQPGTQAGIINDLVWYRLRSHLSTDQSVKIRMISKGKSKGFLALYIRDKMLVRFKKLDEEGRAKNYPTPFQQDYDTQLPMDEVPPATRLVFGYVMDDCHTGFARLELTCPFRGEILWKQMIEEHNAGQVKIEFPPVSPVEETVVKVTKPKQPLQAREQ